MNTKPWHIAFCVDESYMNYIKVPIKSIIVHNDHQIVFHIVSDIITPSVKSKLLQEFSSYPNIKFQFHNVNINKFKNLPVKKHWPIHVWVRVLLPNILSTDIDKVLYLDADTLIVNSLNNLFNINLECYSLAGVIDIQHFFEETYSRCKYKKEYGYICAGILLINVKYWREYHLTEKIINWAELNKNNLYYLDQDAINYVCSETKLLLPIKYGILDCFFYSDYLRTPSYWRELKECLISPVIIHYAGYNPWFKDSGNPIMLKRWITYNKLLKKPIKRKYLSKGILKFKIIIWKFLHIFENLKDKEKLISDKLMVNIKDYI